MTCDHEASKASLRVFLASTIRHDFQDDGEEVLLLGACKGCNSTLGIAVDLTRGSIVRGEIDTTTGTVTAPPGSWDDEPLPFK